MLSTFFEWFCPSILIPSRILRELSEEEGIGASTSPVPRHSLKRLDNLKKLKLDNSTKIWLISNGKTSGRMWSQKRVKAFCLV